MILKAMMRHSLLFGRHGRPVLVVSEFFSVLHVRALGMVATKR